MLILLLLCLATPAAAAMLLMLFRGSMVQRTARWIALGGSCAAMLASLGLAHQYRELPVPITVRSQTAVQENRTLPIQPRFEMRRPWFSSNPGQTNDSNALNLQLHIGLDGVSIVLIVLTTILTVSSVLISWESIQNREAEFYAAILVLEVGLVGVFSAFDLILFYVFFELTLIPLFFLIAIWGGPQRRFAAIKFFLYTLVGSLVTLLGLVTLVLHVSGRGLADACSIPDLAAWLQVHPLDSHLETAIFLALSAGFLIKVPVFPFHTWLPLAHTEAPTAGSVLLAGVLLKLGTYGFFRLCLPFFPDACVHVGLPLFGGLAVIGIVYGSLCSLAQKDIKKLVAYTSVAHLGFCMLGMFALNVEGLTGSVLQMINHGLSTEALFLLVGMVYDRYHTRQLDELGGLASKLPLLACGMVFISMAGIGLPGLNGFVGEVLCLTGMFARHPLYAVVGTTGVVLGAWYLLTMLQHAFFGPLKEPRHAEPHITDINLPQLLAVVPLAILCLWIGVRPEPVLELIRPDVAAVASLYANAPSAFNVAADLPARDAPLVVADAASVGRHAVAISSNPIDNATSVPTQAASAAVVDIPGVVIRDAH